MDLNTDSCCLKWTRGGQQGQGVQARSSLGIAEDERVLSPAEKLPAEMFYQIFRNVDKETLKYSREVCTTWRNRIDDGQLMKSLTFTVVDMEEFLASQIASKVKSIRFTQPLEGLAITLQELFIKIAPTIEEVFFNFDYPVKNQGDILKSRNTQRQKLMFITMLRFCTRLNNLTITSQENDYDFIKGCTADSRNTLVLSKIEYLSVIVTVKYFEDLKMLVVNLPNLCKLDLNCHYLDKLDNVHNSGQKVVDLVLDHLRKYNGKLQEISLTYYLKNLNIFCFAIIEILLSVGQRYENTNVKCSANLNTLSYFDETVDIQVNKNSCRAIKDGWLTLYHFPDTDTSRIAFCSNLDHLCITIYEIPTNLSTTLGFIKTLRKLNYLRIRDRGLEVEADESTILLSGDFFSFGIPSLTTLDFDGRRLGTNSLSFHLCFPNLSKLYIRNYSDNLIADFIFNLTKLDKLRCLMLENLKELTDEHMIRGYDFTDEDDITICDLPAIAGFKSLKHLHIAGYHKLTDNCLRKLALCHKLVKITFGYMRGQDNITDNGLNSLQKARNFFEIDLPPSYFTEKHSGYWNSNRLTPQFDWKYKRFTKYQGWISTRQLR